MSRSVPWDFDPASFARDAEAAARAGGWTIRHLSPTDSGPRPWFQRNAPNGPGAPAVYLSAGIHGDETSGPLALLELLRQTDAFAAFDATIFPILNPNGLARGVRENRDGIDLNRDYRNSKSREILSHIEALATLPRFAAAMMLHEDYEGIGAYLYELNDGASPHLGQEIITAMGRHVPIDLRPEIEEVKAIRGVIQRSDILLKHGPIEERPEWPETPIPFPLEPRIAAQVAAVTTLLKALLIEVRPS
jgi:protein MpaA